MTMPQWQVIVFILVFGTVIVVVGLFISLLGFYVVGGGF